MSLSAPRPFSSSTSTLLFTLHVVLSLLLLQAPSVVHGHGMMCEPRQRGAYVTSKCGHNLPIPADPVIDYCAHCLNAGTVATVKAHLPPGGWKIYEPVKDFPGTGRRAGLCGDPVGTNAHMIGGDFMPLRYKTVPMVAHYKTGGHVDFVAEIDTNHNGYFEYFLCDLDSCGESDIHGKCFKNGHCYKLDRVPHPDCQDPNQNTHYECGPIDDKYPGRWYLPCRNTGHVGVHIVGGPSGTMRYRLPKGVKCKHCVIQWYWATANSCAPRGLLEYMARLGNPFGTTCESDGGGRGTFRHGMTQCGGEAVPEEFWSCADVQISDDGKPAGAVAAVGEPMSSPIPSDEDKLKKNPDEVLKKAGEELKKDIQEEVAGAQDELTKEQIAAKKGLCLLEGEKCDGSVRCCDWQQVCVYGMLSSSFTCRFWWALWEEAELMQKTGYHMPPDGDVGDGDMTIVTSTTTEPLPPAAEVTQAMVPAVVPPSPSYSPSPMHNNPGAYNQQAMAGMPQQPQPPAVPSPSMQPSYYKAPVQNPQATSTQQPAKKKCGPKCQKWYEYLRWKRWLRIKAKLDLQKKQRNRRKRWAAKKKNRRKNSWRRRNSGRGKKWRKVKGRRNNKGRSYRKRHPWWTRRRWNKSGRRSKWHRRRW